MCAAYALHVYCTMPSWPACIAEMLLVCAACVLHVCGMSCVLHMHQVCCMCTVHDACMHHVCCLFTACAIHAAYASCVLHLPSRCDVCMLQHVCCMRACKVVHSASADEVRIADVLLGTPSSLHRCDARHGRGALLWDVKQQQFGDERLEALTSGTTFFKHSFSFYRV